jgi:hypothetical protein
MFGRLLTDVVERRSTGRSGAIADPARVLRVDTADVQITQ